MNKDAMAHAGLTGAEWACAVVGSDGGHRLWLGIAQGDR